MSIDRHSRFVERSSYGLAAWPYGSASIRVAREQDCRTVRLDTYVENIPARRLYERCDFTDLGCHTVRYDGTDLNQFHLFEYVL